MTRALLWAILILLGTQVILTSSITKKEAKPAPFATPKIIKV